MASDLLGTIATRYFLFVRFMVPSKRRPFPSQCDREQSLLPSAELFSCCEAFAGVVHRRDSYFCRGTSNADRLGSTATPIRQEGAARCASCEVLRVALLAALFSENVLAASPMTPFYLVFLPVRLRFALSVPMKTRESLAVLLSEVPPPLLLELLPLAERLEVAPAHFL